MWSNRMTEVSNTKIFLVLGAFGVLAGVVFLAFGVVVFVVLTDFEVVGFDFAGIFSVFDAS